MHRQENRGEHMRHENRGYGLMVGIAVGFAVWGGVKVQNTGFEQPISSHSVIREVTGSEAIGDEVNNSEMMNSKKTDSQAVHCEDLKLHALSAVLIDGDSGRILYEKDAGTFRPMASTTKIMTCILALENGNLSDFCTVSAHAASQPKVHLGARTGQQFQLRDLLYSLMLESHNDSAVMIAEHIAGSVENFAEMMNQKARDLGCLDTCFITPNGLDATITSEDGSVRTHGTTAADLAAIMRYCIMESPKREEFLEITRTSNYGFTDQTGKHSYSCVNHNALLSILNGTLSGKTGFTGGAGYSYVGALEDEGRTFILALLGCGWPPHKTYKWEDSRKLFSYGKQYFHYRDVYQELKLKPVEVEDGIPEKSPDQSSETLSEEHKTKAMVELTTGIPQAEQHFTILLADDEQVQVKVDVPECLKAPVRAGEIVGNVQYILDGKTIRRDPVFAAENVEKKNLRYFMELVTGYYLLCDEYQR